MYCVFSNTSYGNEHAIVGDHSCVKPFFNNKRHLSTKLSVLILTFYQWLEYHSTLINEVEFSWDS